MVGFIAVRCLLVIEDVVSKVQDMRAETLVVEGGFPRNRVFGVMKRNKPRLSNYSERTCSAWHVLKGGPGTYFDRFRTRAW